MSTTPTKLRIRRLSRGLTQEELAKAAGVTANLISALESGTALQRLAVFLGEEDPLELLQKVAVTEELK